MTIHTLLLRFREKRSHARLKRMCMSLLVGLFLTAFNSFAHGIELPTLIFESSESLQPFLVRLQKLDPSRFQASMQLVGLSHAGEPIRVIVATEHSEWARHAPNWASGYALSRLGIIVILPERIVTYPYDSLEHVLSHEVAHILTERAANGHTMPRWFDEGLAMVAAHSWDFEERARLTWAMVTGDPVSLDTLDTLFHRNGSSARQAYVLSHALVRFFIQEFGREWPRRMLADLAQGLTFEESFVHTTFLPLERAEARFWANQTVWTRWVPAVTSSAVLWVGILGLAWYAFKKQRQRAEALKRKWKEENSNE